MRNVVVAVGLLASLALASNAGADIIYKGVNYGGIDELEGGFYKSSSCGTLAQCEEATLADALGLSISDVTLTKVDTTLSDWIYVDDGDSNTNLVAFNFAAYGIIDPLAYIVKIGNAVYDFYLYTNKDSLQYALIDLNDDGIVPKSSGNITISSLSHISTVPEAGSLSFLLSGLTALGLVSLRRFRFSR